MQVIKYRDIFQNLIDNMLAHNEILSLDKDFFQKLALEYKLQFLDLNDKFDFEKYLYNLPLALMEKYEILCFEENDECIKIISYKPLHNEILEKLQNIFRDKNIYVFIVEFAKFEYFFEKIKFLIKFQNYSCEIEKILNSQNNKEGDFLEQVLFLILSYAGFLKASDIHFEPLENMVKLRFRIDGILQSIICFTHEIYQALLTHIKIISLLNVAEQRNAQDGSFSKYIHDQQYDFRVSIMPLLFGQSVVIRILKQEENIFKLENLLIKDEIFKKIKLNIQALSGLILFCGPTGSGKSTFMHSLLNELDESKKIITLEDPIEYKLTKAQQILLNTKADFDFSNALRGVLRQDPDVIMIGEIRDEESLDIVLKASLSGHLVFSTLHTNNALEAIFRMIHMGAKSYLIARSLKLIIAQRLVRRLCECKEEISEIIYKNQTINGKFYKAKGCPKCMMSGYKGRIMIAEFLFLDANVKNLIENNSSFEQIQAYILKNDFLSLSEDALDKVKKGLTSIEEIWKVLL